MDNLFQDDVDDDFDEFSGIESHEEYISEHMTETDESISYKNCKFTGKDGESEWYDFKESQKAFDLLEKKLTNKKELAVFFIYSKNRKYCIVQSQEELSMRMYLRELGKSLCHNYVILRSQSLNNLIKLLPVQKRRKCYLCNYNAKRTFQQLNDCIRELKVLCELNHQNIVEYFESYFVKSTVWIIMEYCVGSVMDIVEVIKRTFTENEISAIVKFTLLGLIYLHSEDAIHRDIKAGNILLTCEGLIKIADFGSASLVCPANSFVGTPYWMSPEIILAMDEGQYDQRTDVWSLGITCIELAQRMPPYFNLHAMSALYYIAQKDPPKLENKEKWSQNFISFVAECLVFNYKNRKYSEELVRHNFISQCDQRKIIQDIINNAMNIVNEIEETSSRRIANLKLYKKEMSDSISGSTIVDSSPNIRCSDSNDSIKNENVRGDNISSSSDQSKYENVSVFDESGFLIESDIALSKDMQEIADNADLLKNELNLVGQDKNNNESKNKYLSLKKFSKEMRSNAFDLSNINKNQLNMYKKVRKQHRKETDQIEKKFQDEKSSLIQIYNRENENLIQKMNKEMIKLKSKNEETLNDYLKSNTIELKKFHKKLKYGTGKELKNFEEMKRKEYKYELAMITSTLQKERKSIRKTKEKDLKIEFNSQKVRQYSIRCKSQKIKNMSVYRRHERTLLVFYFKKQEELLFECHKLKPTLVAEIDEFRIQHEKLLKENLCNHIMQMNERKVKLNTNLQKIEMESQLQYNTDRMNNLRRLHVKTIKENHRNNKKNEIKTKKIFTAKNNTILKNYKSDKSKLKSNNASPCELKSLRDDYEITLANFKKEFDEALINANVDITNTLELEKIDLLSSLESELSGLVKYQNNYTQTLLKNNDHDLLQCVSSSNNNLMSIENQIKENLKIMHHEFQEEIDNLRKFHADEIAKFDDLTISNINVLENDLCDQSTFSET
ncbi:Serine/threonine-protein kinase TAO3 [Intoshia linei]|uniref:non-specific serine/threonine protein kinase n=1 Tax=Intoshia linei TaxID=1819745 RepID=A0A177B7U3_9BILA|nr:Serine/threonine-protein kinase TAO3 [Intoshia linei]